MITETVSSTIYESGIDCPLAEVSDDGTGTFYHQNWLGSVVLLTDGSGAKVQSYTYDAWGVPSGFDASDISIPVSSISSRLLFTGCEYDQETSLYHYRVRAYAPAFGRFLQPGSIDFSSRDGNLFRYVSNNPVNLWDPFGLKDYSACETQSILDNVKKRATEGFVKELRNILEDFSSLTGNHGNHDYKNTGNTFNVGDRKMEGGAFSNFLAGYVGYYLGGDLGVVGALAGGILFDLTDSVSKNPWWNSDVDSRGDIFGGASYARDGG